MLAPLAIFGAAALAAGGCFLLSYLSENGYLVPDLSGLGDAIGLALAGLAARLQPSPTPVVLAATLPAVYFCAASGRWRDRETKRFAKAPAA